jgi:hypothetical protein
LGRWRYPNIGYPKGNVHIIYIDDKQFLIGASLKIDGANFVDWYFRLKNVLWQNSALYVLKEFLGDKPGDIVCVEEKILYLQRRD